MTDEELLEVGLRLDVQGPVATITLDRPEVRNAQTPAMWRALKTVGDSLSDDVRVVVVTGAEGNFSSGLDRTMLDPTASAQGETVVSLLTESDETISATIDDYQQAFTFLRDPRFVSVAKVRGHAIGAGFQLALSCDLRFVSKDAKFAMKESALGLVPDLTGTQPLVEAVGYARALEICATARTVTGEEAVRIGLAQGVHTDEELDDVVETLVGSLCGTMPEVVSETKALLQGAATRSLDEQRRLEREAQVRRFRALVKALGA